jgi:Domain of unknown function (DUF4388)
MSPFELLQVLSATHETGMLFVRTAQMHQARIGLANGQVVHISYAIRHGGEALARLANTQSASASFTRGLVAERHDDLPPGDLLMQALATILGEGAATLPTASGPNTVPLRTDAPTTTTRAFGEGVATAPRARPVDELRRSSATLDQLRSLMVDYVGPIGGLLVDQEMEAGFKTWTELVDRLAREVSPDAEARAFRIAALRLLR